MTIRVTITKPGVTDGYGLPMVVGTTYTVEENFGLSLISQGRATDTDASLVNPGVGSAQPGDVVFCNAATLAAPTAQMLASYGVVYALDVAPFTRYQSNGTALAPLTAFSYDSANNIAAQTGPSGSKLALSLSQQYKRWKELITAGNAALWDDRAGSGMLVTVDPTVTFNGLPTLRLDIPASSSGTYRVGTSAATLIPPYNWDGTQLAVAVRSSNMTAVSPLTGVLLGDATFTNYNTFAGQKDAANIPQANWVAGDWIIARGTTKTATGSPSTATPQRLRINLTVSSVATATQVWIGFVGIAAPKKSTVIISIDDGYASGYSFVADVARYYKIPVSFGIDSSYVGTANYFTAAQIQELHADKSNLFEFVTHGYANHTINTTTVAAYIAEQVQTRAYLRSLGIMGDGPNHHPWVQSLYSNDAQAQLKAAGFLSARAGAATPLSMHDALMTTGDEKRVYQLINCCTLTTGLDLAEAQTAIDTACDTENYGVTHVNAHDFAASDAASPPTWSYDKFVDLMGWLDVKRTDGECDIKTWGQWYADLNGAVYQK